MRIAFIVVGNDRSGELNGYNIRYGGTGGSGTESSVIYVAEYLSTIGYDVTISLEICETPKSCNGVFYTDLNFTDVDNKEYDILITCLWFNGYSNLPIKVNNALLYWCHLAWGYSYHEMIEYVKTNNLKFGLISISNWAKNHNMEIYHIIKNSGIDVNHVVIPNSVAIDMIKETLSSPPERHPHRFVHHGQWSRGGSVALKSFEELGWEDGDFKSFDYVNKGNSLDKKSLFNVIASSEYFVYPQITHGNLVYKDTFSVSIAEAIGLGVIVLTYPLGAVPEYFGEYCQFLDYPPNVDIEKLNTERLSTEPGLEYTQNIVDKINWLENNPQIKEEIRNKGIKYISETFDINKIGPLWDTYLKSFKNNNVFNFFHKIYYVNPDNYFDRKIEVEKEFSKYNILAERLPGYTLSLEQSENITKNGGILCDRIPERLQYLANVRGATLGHLHAVFLAKYQKFKNVLIFEDDVMFSDNILEDLSNCLEDLKEREWDLFFLGCNPVEKFNQVTDNISKCGGGVYMSHAYVVNHTFYDKILNFNFSYFWAFDQHLFGLARDPQNNIFMSNKSLVNQKPGFSNAECQYVDYNLAVEHNYKINFIQKK